ncbi:MAG: hypothetical protein ACEQSA_06880, partial [Weeksellaceae bacterium]
ITNMRKITNRENLHLRPSLDFLFKDLEDLDIHFRANVVDLILSGGYMDSGEIEYYQACEDFLSKTETVWYLVNNKAVLEILPNQLNDENLTGELLQNLIFENEDEIINILNSL